MDSLNIASCGFLTSTKGYSVPGVLTLGFLSLLGAYGAGLIDTFEVLKVRKKAVEMIDHKNFDLRKRTFKL